MSDVRGRAEDRLRQMVKSGRIFHGYIIEGPDQEVREASDDFVRAAICERGDGSICGTCVYCRRYEAGNTEEVIRLGSEGTIKDKDVEGLISQTLKKSLTGRRTFMIISGAGSMTVRAQNRLLKTLEEPPEGVTIILETDNSESLVQTIRSRCQHIKLFSEGVKRHEEDAEFRQRAIDTAAQLLKGKPFYRIYRQIEEFASSRPSAERFISIAETFFRDILVSAYDSSGRLTINKDSTDLIGECAARLSPDQLTCAIDACERAMADITANVSAGHALKYMVFDIQEKLYGKVS